MFCDYRCQSGQSAQFLRTALSDWVIRFEPNRFNFFFLGLENLTLTLAFEFPTSPSGQKIDENMKCV